MRVFVTGVGGFIGSRLAAALLARGDSVVGFDNFDPYYPREHKERRLHDLLPHPRFTLEEGDLRDAPLLVRLFAQHRPDAVAHLAAMAAVRYSVQHPLLYGEANVQGSVHLLDAARKIGAPRVVLASTGSVYGRDTPVPFREDAAAALPLAPYPASKRAMELFAYTYHHLWGLPTTVLRFFNVYGPLGRPDMMPWQWSMKIAAGDEIVLYDGGRLKRDWTYISDIQRGFLAALDAGLPWEILNLGCGRPVENLAFVRILEGLIGREAVIVDQPAPSSEPPITYADVSRARETLGWEPRVNVEEGLAEFVAWLRAAALLPE